MITFSQLGKYGRLGNQFFQYAALKGLSVKNGYDIALMSDLKNTVWHGQKCLLLISILIILRSPIVHRIKDMINLVCVRILMRTF